MKKSKLKYLIIPLIAILILAIPFFNFTAFRIKNYTDEFEKINDFILANDLSGKNISDLILKEKVNDFSFLNQVISESELCSINYYNEKGIVYKFQCNNNSSDNFIDSDDKCYLIKILNGKTELLSYEQFIDYSKSPIELNDDWYLIEQNITYD